MVLEKWDRRYLHLTSSDYNVKLLLPYHNDINCDNDDDNDGYDNNIYCCTYDYDMNI